MYDLVEANTDLTHLTKLEDSLAILAEKISALVNARIAAEKSGKGTSTTISTGKVMTKGYAGYTHFDIS